MSVCVRFKERVYICNKCSHLLYEGSLFSCEPISYNLLGRWEKDSVGG